MFRILFLEGPMSSAKTASLLADRFDHQAQGIKTILLTPKTDTRNGVQTISSRLGVSAKADAVITDWNQQLEEICDRAFADDAIIYIDECQFLNYQTVKDISNYCHQLTRKSDQPKTYFKVMAYGLLKDYHNQMFDGSRAWLEEADKIVSFETNCKYPGCDRKATCNFLKVTDRVSPDSNIVIGDKEFISVCQYHYHLLSQVTVSSKGRDN